MTDPVPAAPTREAPVPSTPIGDRRTDPAVEIGGAVGRIWAGWRDGTGPVPGVDPGVEARVRAVIDRLAES